ncbi:helix-turn-helix domain-containing protein [Actinophytocola sp. NPDC049390]|uniref:helix-turn-helix transcriptional regulator n=1 Tax=Actinophytocola sp. NPDC049390 TaxID=3363894 RepID=UPI0037A22DC1
MTDYAERPSAHDILACTWSRSLPSGSPPTHVVPDGCADVLWHRENGRLFVAGPDTRAHRTSLSAGLLVAVRFLPGRAPAGLGVPTSEVRDERVGLDLVWPADRVRRLTDALAATRTVVAAERVLADAVAGLGAGWDPAVPRLVALIRRGDRMRAVADALGWTERQLHRRSLAAFGYGPKTLQQVLRFDHALRLARDGTDLASVAYATGYADQAHLARDVNALAGRPMTALLS